MIHFQHVYMLIAAIIIAVVSFRLTKSYIASFMFFFLMIAASGVYFTVDDSTTKHIMLVDRSPSMKSSNINEADLTKKALASVSNTANVEYLYFGEQSDADKGRDICLSNLESALLKAMTKIKNNGSIHLLSDLNQTDGSILNAVSEMPARNIQLDITLPEYSLVNEAILSEVKIPDLITKGQEVISDVTIESSSNSPAILDVLNNQDGTVISHKLQLTKGFNSYSFPISTDSNEIDYSLTLKSDIDTIQENNVRHIHSIIYEKPNVLVIGQKKNLDSVANKISEYANVNAYIDQSDLDNANLLILADANKQLLDDSFLNSIKMAVLNGMGLLVLPGSGILSEDVMGSEQFVELLPATISRKSKKASVDACLVFIVDTSSSMTGTRLLLAKEIVRKAISRLSEYDKVGIVEFYGNKKWAIPIQHVANKISINREINRLTPGGGTVIYPALEEAYYGLLNVDAASKHIIVITDGGIESVDYSTLLNQISDKNINVSFILTGPPANIGFLADMSQIGGGKFLHARDRFSIPEISVKNLSNKGSNLFKTPHGTLVAADLPVITDAVDLSQINNSLLLSIAAQKKLSAYTVCQAGTEPLLSSWNFGLGKVSLCMSNIFELNNSEKLFQNMCRYLYRQPHEYQYQTDTEALFEVQSCTPNYDLAEEIGSVAGSNFVPQIKVIELDSFFVFLSLVAFISHIIVRRLPSRSLAVFFLLFVLGGSLYADYPELMNNAISSYQNNDDSSLDMFLDAYQVAKSDNDKKYALAWAIVSAQNNGDTSGLEKYLLADMNKNTVQALYKIYMLNGQFSAANRLRAEIARDSQFTDEFINKIDKHLVNTAIISRDYSAAEKYFKERSDLVALMKINLLKGDRESALQCLQGVTDSSITSYQMYFLIESLAQMGFVDQAIEKAVKLRARHDSYYFDSTVLLFNLYLKQDNKDKALVMLKDAVNNYNFSNKQLSEISSLYEKIGDYDQAITINKNLYAKTQAVDILMNIASLEKLSGDLETSYNIWYNLWQECDDPFLLYQIIPNMLDIANKSDVLVDLAINLEDSISQKKSSDKELDLLIDIYTMIGDAFTPIELIKQFYGDDSIVSLVKQYSIYRNIQLYGKCRKILIQLIEKDSDNTEEYLEKFAIISLQSDNFGQADWAAEKLIAGSNDQNLEFTAGILSMMGRYSEALATYEELIEQQPDNYELWLLWSQQAASISDDYRNAALNRLQELIEEDPADDKYLVLADAIMNLKGSENTLRHIYKLTQEKLAATPDKLYYYRLLLDLQDEFEVKEDPVNILLRAASYASESRIMLVKEAMESSGDLSQMRLDLARIMLFMDYQSPPSQDIANGMLFLTLGQKNTAEFLFRLHSLLNADNRGLFFDIADCYQRQSDFSSALHVMLEGLALNPVDLEFLIETAGYYEILGDFKNANKLYVKAYNLCELAKDSASKEKISNSKNISNFERFSHAAFEGMIVTSDIDSLPSEVREVYLQKMNAPEIAVKERAVSTDNSDELEETEKEAKDLDLIEIELQEFVDAGIVNSEFNRKIKEVIDGYSQEDLTYLFEEFSDYASIMGESEASQFLLARLAQKLDLETESIEYITKCFVKNPANKTIDHTLKGIYGSFGLYKELAEVLVVQAVKQAKSPFYWRDITQAYFHAGNLEKAKWANSFAAGKSHYILHLLDSLFLYETEDNIEKLQQYFRKYQVDCRKLNKYYALRWNNWYRRDQGSPETRDTAYDVLARYHELLNEFIRYNKVVYPDRRDYHEYNKALDNCKKISNNTNHN